MHKLVIFFIFLLNVTKGQTTKLDSLLSDLKVATEDTTRCKILNDMTQVNPSYFYTDSINEVIIAISNKNLAKVNLNTTLKNSFLISLANAYNNKIYLSKSVGNTEQAMNYAFKTLKIDEQLHDFTNIAYDYYSIATIFSSMKNLAKSQEYYNKAFITAYKYKVIDIEISALSGLSVLYLDNKEYLKARESLNKTLKLCRESNNKLSLLETLDQFSTLYLKMKLPLKAKPYVLECQKISPSINNDNYKYFLFPNYIELALQMSDFKQAESYSIEMLKIAQNRNSLSETQKANNYLSKIYASIGNWQLAYEKKNISEVLKDSIQLQLNSRDVIQKSIQKEYQYRTLTDSLKTAEEKKITVFKLNQEKKQRFALYAGLAIVLVFSGFLYNRFKVTQKQKNIIEIKEIETQHQKQIIEQKHKEINESVDYAERIQKGYITSHDFLNEHLKTGFILFKPKDKVSGDFYWADKMSNGRIAVCVADSTGHGIPGAFMSLLNISLLNEAVLSKGFTNNVEILNFIRKTLMRAIQPNAKGEGGNDGMDCVLFSINYNTLELEFTGANNSLWIVRKNNVVAQVDTEVLEVEAPNTFPKLPLASRASADDNFNAPHFSLIELKGDKMPVGRSLKSDISFTSQTFQLQKGDTIYASTDGFIDQFGGEKQKKFMSKQLKDVLLSICHLHEDEQKEKLHTIFENWKGNLEQVDDVTVMGIKI